MLRFVVTLALAALSARAVAAPVKVVTTLPTYASIAEAVGGERVTAAAISGPDEDAHFVKPKPSLALMLRDADLFVTTGLDLELWAPVLVDKSGNRRIRDGQPGFVAASQGVPLLDVPASASREAGDVHAFGNPHIHTSPLNVKTVAGNIAAGLARVDPGGAEHYRRGLADFRRRIDEALYGKRLLAVLPSETLDPLARSGKLVPFLGQREYQGRPLLDRLGGWLGAGLAFRGREIVTYHKNWVYFAELFGLTVVDHVEPKPGIPPSARHVHHLLRTIERREIAVILAASYFDPRKPRDIAERTGARAIVVPLQPGGSRARDYFALLDLWTGELAKAFATSRAGHP
ncbi:MAG TPA: metal ABC transporter substrate-binding protein [Thermoanaerobaculia bacterium]|nr:metal ABC transporter substrate-binding protein [Thermoanaerobaculia bacterium]